MPKEKKKRLRNSLHRPERESRTKRALRGKGKKKKVFYGDGFKDEEWIPLSELLRDPPED